VSVERTAALGSGGVRGTIDFSNGHSSLRKGNHLRRKIG